MTEERDIFEIAVRAADHENAAAKLYEQLVHSLNRHHAGNERSIVASLQNYAKRLAESHGEQAAIQFKQRSTEIMLRMHTELRRGGAARIVDVEQPSPPTQRKSDLPTASLDRARDAAASQDPVKSDELATNLISDLNEQHNHDQREVAAVLQQIARALEAESSELAMNFKQISCAAMLKLNLRSRGRDKLQA